MPSDPTVEEVRELLRRYSGDPPDAPICLECGSAMHVDHCDGEQWHFECNCDDGGTVSMRRTEPDERIAALCRYFLASQDAEDERPAPDLPQAIKDELFRQACLCADTEAAAQKQPCACRTFMLLEQIEEWGKSLASREPMTAGEFAGLVVAFCDEWGDKFAELLELDKSWTFNQVIDATKDIAREHNIDIVEPKK